MQGTAASLSAKMRYLWALLSGSGTPCRPSGLRTTKAMIKGEKNNIDLSFEDMQFLLALVSGFALGQVG